MEWARYFSRLLTSSEMRPALEALEWLNSLRRSELRARNHLLYQDRPRSQIRIEEGHSQDKSVGRMQRRETPTVKRCDACKSNVRAVCMYMPQYIYAHAHVRPM